MPLDLGLDLGLDPLGFNPLATSRRRQQSLLPEFTPEEQQSILSRLGSTALSGLSYVGQYLDKQTGSRGIRGLLAGKPRELLSLIPGSDVIGITRPEDIVHGKELLGIQNDPSSWGDDILGFGAEVLLDPTLAFGGFIKGGLTGAGALAKSAGVLDDATKAAAKAASTATKKVGPRAARTMTTLRKAIDDPMLPGGNIAAYRKLSTAAEGAGKKLDDVLDEPLGALLSVQPPFMPHMGSIAPGKAGMKYLEGMDALGDTLRWGKLPGTNYSPGKHAARLFAGSSGGMKTRPVQEAFKADIADPRQARHSAVIEPVMRATQLLKESGLTDEQSASYLRMIGEGTAPTDPAKIQAYFQTASKVYPDVARIKSLLEDFRTAREKIGASSDYLHDPEIEYWTRYVSGMGPEQFTAGRKMLSTKQASQIARKLFLKGIVGGTETVRDIVKKYGGQNLTPKQIFKEIDDNYRHLLPNHMKKDIRQLAKFVARRSPEQAEVGAFGNHPLSDVLSHLKHETDAKAARETLLNLLAKHAQPIPSGTPGSHVPIGKIMKSAGLNRGTPFAGGAKTLLERMGRGVIPDPDMWEKQSRALFKKQGVPADIAEDLISLGGIFKSPKEVGELVGFYDSITNLFKAGVLTWPSRYVRDVTSGQIQNLIAGEWSPRAMADSWKILRGKGNQIDALQYPVVKQMLTEQGLPHTKENAWLALQRHIASQEMVGASQSSMAQVGLQTAPPGSVFELIDKLPGARPFSLRKTASKLIPKSLEEANPLNVAGVGNRDKTLFSVVQAGNDAGVASDTLNRLVPYLHQLRKGVDPAVARKRVMDLQVDYSNKALTPFEKETMTRVMPFYRFSKGAAPHTISELSNRPAGPLAQVVRGTARVDRQDDFVPEHLRQSLAIALPGGKDGMQKYLTGLGLMHEDVLNLFRPGQTLAQTLSGTGQEILGRTNPLIKAPIEVGADRQFFTGRELQDLESSTGRIVSNLGITEQPPEIPMLVDQALSNSPVSRILSTARTASDPRKTILDKALNLGTGIRISDIDMEKARNIAIREAIENSLRGQRGVRRLRPHLYVRPEDIPLLSDEELALMALYKQQADEQRAAARAK